MESRGYEFNYNPHGRSWDELFTDPPGEGLETLIIEDLKRSGLNPETLKRAKAFIYNGNADGLKQLLGYASFGGHELTRGFKLLGFPYFNRDGDIELVRFRLYPPLSDAKYLHPKETPPVPYILSEVWDVAGKPHKPIAITEGEKKALKLLQEGLPAIALSGVWNFKANKTARDEEDRYLLRELRDFNWEGRTVYLFFDADVWVNPQVRRALFELSFKLTALGAVIRVPVWHVSEGKGIDDFLAGKRDPKEALEKLIEKARPAEDLVRREDVKTVVKALAETDFSEAQEVAEALYRALSKKLGIPARALKKAVWAELKKKEEDNAQPFTEEELRKAEELLKDPDLVKKWLEFVNRIYLGREEEKLLIKLATLTRHFRRGLSVVLTGTSSVGKSSLIEAVLKTVHSGDIEDFTRISENYLLYRKAPLNNRIITFFEIHGTKSSAHIIRTALSEGKLRLGTVIKTERGLEAKDVEKETNGLVILSTFASGGIDWELATRVLRIEISHNPDLARQVLEWKATLSEEELEEIKKRSTHLEGCGLSHRARPGRYSLCKKAGSAFPG